MPSPGFPFGCISSPLVTVISVLEKQAGCEMGVGVAELTKYVLVVCLQVLLSLRLLLMMKPNVLSRVSRDVSYGLHELLKTNAANIHSSDDWYTLFSLLECIGAGVKPPPSLQATTGPDNDTGNRQSVGNPTPCSAISSCFKENNTTREQDIRRIGKHTCFPFQQKQQVRNDF